MKTLFSLTTFMALLCLSSFNAAAQSNSLFSLQNLERERAALLTTLTDANISMEVRQQKSNSIYRRMADIERMVLRDERLANSDKVLVQNAFANYDLTFLVHASAERKIQPLSQWMNTLGINAASIAQSKQGYR
ncbi:hypothetical protein [Paraglaciecola hydrolytica]|uniref:Uncharacterized protein n=1 Tax=Paraglaciecola hydrolytica TaxID=1799789 RepID=A0A135ZZ35_9ALTE|nr:hypothetical protein [Paraglaciecola hydrolytica]KXI28224.1 hypothetical protein AX660_17755 [Paraglaciecola hydrolytica]